MESFGEKMKILLIGSHGAIGQALIEELATKDSVQTIHACSRNQTIFAHEKYHHHVMDPCDERSVETAAKELSSTSFDLIIIATGILHNEDIKPEKNIASLSQAQFEQYFLINTIGPALVLKHFSPLLAKGKKSMFAVMSARVGSIEDNQLGGWYGYRASKAALNMIVKNASIECKRQNKSSIFVMLHPGTVDSPLSKPFSHHVPEGQLFSPSKSAKLLLEVMDDLTAEKTGGFYDYDGKQIPF